MKKLTPTLTFDTRIDEAIDYINTHNMPFVGVMAATDRYHGVLTESVMMRIYLRYLNQREKDALIYYRDCFEPIQLIQETEQFPEVVKKVMTAVGHRVFVIDSTGHVVGHLTAKDVLPFFIENFAHRKPEVAEKLQGKKDMLESIRSDLYLFESFFVKSPFMMHSANQSGEIQMANEVLHHVLGYSYGELIGKTIFDIYPPEMHAAARDGLKKILDKGYHNMIRSQMVHKSGRRIDVELVSRALFDQNEKAIGTMTVSRPMDMNHLLEVLPNY